MEDRPVVVATSSEGREVATGFRSVVVVELDGDGALLSVNVKYQRHLKSVAHHCRLKHDI